MSYKFPKALDEFVTIAALADYLAEHPNNDADNPIEIKLRINLGMTEHENGWWELLNVIAAAGKFVNLDLSACTMSGTEFNADRSIGTGKNRIVSIVLPYAARSVTEFGGYSFYDNNSHFTNLTAASGTWITSIGDSAFSSCTSLTEVSFPAAISIGEFAFYDCTSLIQVSFLAAASIGKSAFLDCTSLTEVSFPAATYIGDWAFRDCTGLTQASFPTVETIGGFAFSGCTGLTEVSFPAAETIGSGAFGSCTGLTQVSFPVAASIGGYAFNNCTGLTQVSFPEVTSIDYNAFYRCTSLTEASFPVTSSIGGSAFQDCTSLASVTLGTIPEANFAADYWSPFPGNLRDVYFADGGGAGTYVTDNPGWDPMWRKE